jgi:NAD-dependent SIR2 family protein deacetylase
MSNQSEIPVSPETKEESQPLGFSWITTFEDCQRKEGINITLNPEEAYAYVVFSTPLPEEMTETEKGKLSRYVAADGKRYCHCGYGKFDLERACNMDPDKLPSLTHHNQRQRGNETIRSFPISERGVADVIRSGKTIVYTGAGISVAAGTPDMKELMACLGIDRSKKVDEFARMVMFNSEVMRQRLMKLQESFFKGVTPAHMALAIIQRVTGVRIATENLDMLGEAAGQKLIKRGDINKMFPDAELIEIGCIVTVGLRADDSGLLYRFKQINPNGRIVALNTEPPPYLDKTDRYLEGDAQVTLPKIAEIVKG